MIEQTTDACLKRGLHCTHCTHCAHSAHCTHCTLCAHCAHSFISFTVLVVIGKTKVTDQYLPPFVLTDSDGEPVGKIQDGDSVCFFNYRGDRAIEITKAFELGDEFDHFDRGQVPNVCRAPCCYVHCWLRSLLATHPVPFTSAAGCTK